jgi:hypothetical protein
LGSLDVDQAETSWEMSGGATFMVAVGGNLSGDFTYNGHDVYADNFELRTGNSLAYLLTINQGSGSGSYTNGAGVSITASNAPSGQIFDRWAGSTQYLASVTSATTTVTMPAQAITLTPAYKLTGVSSGDDFNDNVKDTTLWGDDLYFAGTTNASLQETSGRLEFRKLTEAGSVIRPWIYSVGSYTQSWEVAVDAHLSDIAFSWDGAWANQNLFVANRQDTNLFSGVQMADALVIALDLYRDHDVLHRGYELTSMVNGTSLTNAPNYGYVTTADQTGQLKIAFNAATKVLTASYNGNVLGWVDVEASGSNWEMTDGATFGIGLVGSGPQSVSVAAGEMYADNFSITVPSTPEFLYTTNNGEITVTAYIGTSSSVDIPDIIDGLSVTSIGISAFAGCTSLTNITLPSGITSIGDTAFYNCSGLLDITIPGSVTRIGGAAFGNCVNLTAVYFLGNAPSFTLPTVFPGPGSLPVVYRLSGASGWPAVPDLWSDRPTALWEPQASDIDADGIPDWWEQQYFGGTGVDPSTRCSNSINTVIEAYVAGLDPTDPNAYFGITGGDAQSRILQWPAVSGRVYSVCWSTNLLNGFVPVLTNYTGGVVTDTLHSAESTGFYKIKVQLAQ